MLLICSLTLVSCTQKTTTEKAEQPLVNANQTNVSTADWVTYRNEEHGYEIRYPKNWKVESSNEIFIGKEEYFTMFNPLNNTGPNFMFITKITADNLIRCQLDHNPDYKIIDPLEIDGYKSYVSFSTEDATYAEEDITTYRYCVETPNTRLAIHFRPTQKKDNVSITKENFLSILKTLKFIEE